MHTLLKVTMTDVSLANEAIQNGRLQKIFQQIAKNFNPSASFFYSEYGYRTALFAMDMKDASQIPLITEPLFNELNAKVELFPAMDPAELSQGLASWEKQASSYSSLS